MNIPNLLVLQSNGPKNFVNFYDFVILFSSQKQKETVRKSLKTCFLEFDLETQRKKKNKQINNKHKKWIKIQISPKRVQAARNCNF